MYTSKGCAKFGLCFFAGFILLPEWVQVGLLDVIFPTAVGSFVYGNYQLYKLREWSPFTVDLGLLAIIFGIVFYIRNRRQRKKIRGGQKDALKIKENVMMEMAAIQLQSEPGSAFKTGNLKKERIRRASEVHRSKLNIDTINEDGSEGADTSNFVVSPLSKAHKQTSSGFDIVPLDTPSSKKQYEL